MRTTLDLTPEAWSFAKAVARERNKSLGTVVSEFILKKPERVDAGFRMSAAGFPTFSSDRPSTTEELQEFLHEDPMEY